MSRFFAPSFQVFEAYSYLGPKWSKSVQQHAEKTGQNKAVLLNIVKASFFEGPVTRIYTLKQQQKFLEWIRQRSKEEQSDV